MSALLDVNVLLALFDPSHLHHGTAHEWFRTSGGTKWATCPLTLNGCVRVFSQAGYPNIHTPADAVAMLRMGCDHPSHEFWPDSVSILDDTIFSLDEIPSGKHLTDVYLLGLAVRRGGQLVTFDRSIPWRAVKGAKAGHLKVLGGK